MQHPEHSSQTSNKVKLSIIRVNAKANEIVDINEGTSEVAIGKIPTNQNYIIPVVLGHTSSNECIDNVFYDAGRWRIFTDITQKVSIGFYDIEGLALK